MPTPYQLQVSHDARPDADRGTASQAPAEGGAARPGSHPWAGPALMFGGALSNQLGAATGALAFGVIGPAGVVAVRQWIAAIVLLAAGRPRWRSFTGAQWRPVVLLAVAYGTMNLSLYTAIGRLGLGLAVTLEFLGPLAVALATSRRRADLVCALVAGAGVVVLTRPRPATDYLGIGLGLLAAGVLGQLHPAQPGDRAAPARRGGLGGGRGTVRAGLRAGRDHGADPAPADVVALRARPPPGSCPRPCRSSPTCWRCAGFRPATSAYS